jgi:hypothetical protein
MFLFSVLKEVSFTYLDSYGTLQLCGFVLQTRVIFSLDVMCHLGGFYVNCLIYVNCNKCRCDVVAYNTILSLSLKFFKNIKIIQPKHVLTFQTSFLKVKTARESYLLVWKCGLLKVFKNFLLISTHLHFLWACFT